VPEVEEDKPEPDLDELLELFREPEEEPRRKKAMPGSVWLMLAFVLSLAGVWMAARTGAAPRTAKALGPPVLPTKVSDRKQREGNGEPVDVVKDYIARCQKGMTAREVRWIIEDFQKAGLETRFQRASLQEFTRQRRAQHAWYLDLLADGLRLGPEQRRTARGKLAGLFEEAVADFQKSLSEQASEPHEGDGGQAISKFIDAEQWLTDERYAPWELCELKERQLNLTWFDWINSRRNAEPDSLTYEPNMPWLGDRMLLGNAEKGSSWIGDFSTGDAPGEINGAGSILTFISEQDFSRKPWPGAGMLECQALACHPAQLKTLLLFNPSIVERLLARIDAAEK